MKYILRALVVGVVLCAVLIFASVLVHAVWGGADTSSGITPPAGFADATALATSSLPVRLQIPTLGIDANVQYAGINGRGDLAVPTNFTDVAWYEGGPAPGQAGSAVLDGHVDNGLALPGVFKHLADIKTGDSVYVKTKNGQMLHFVVYDIETYPYTRVPLQTVFAQTNAAHLNLITCKGSWVASNKTYDQRLVVYTKLVS